LKIEVINLTADIYYFLLDRVGPPALRQEVSGLGGASFLGDAAGCCVSGFGAAARRAWRQRSSTAGSAGSGRQAAASICGCGCGGSLEKKDLSEAGGGVIRPPLPQAKRTTACTSQLLLLPKHHGRSPSIAQASFEFLASGGVIEQALTCWEMVAW